MEIIVELSVSEDELFSATQCTQDMRYVHRIINRIGLKVNLLISSEVNNQGYVDLENNWSDRGGTHDVQVHHYLLMRQISLICLLRTREYIPFKRRSYKKILKCIWKLKLREGFIGNKSGNYELHIP